MMRFCRVVSFATSLAVASAGLASDAAEKQLAIERLAVVGGALYVGAHPDDENTAALAWLANEMKVHATYLSLTRGSGGQNLIGTEQGAVLGVLRTQELLAARSIDGADQRFTRAVDFGYSRSPEETLRIWDRDTVLSDVVWAIRSLRPDVIITRFPDTGAGGHGHHTASAILAREAFAAAADPSRFPEQLRWVDPWQATRLVWNTWRPEQAGPDEALVTADLGVFNPLLGRSYGEIAATARSMHKTQGFGSAPRYGALPGHFLHVAGRPARTGLFDDVDLTWGRLRGGAETGRLIEHAVADYDPADPGAAIADLLAAYDAMPALPRDPRVTRARAELLGVVRDLSGLVLEASTDTEQLTRGATVEVSILAVNRAASGLRLDRVELPFGTPAAVIDTALERNRPVTATATVTVPDDTPLSTPAWLAEPAVGGTYTVASRTEVGLPDGPPPLTATFVVDVHGRTLALPVEVRFRTTDRVRGEVSRPLAVVPRVSVALDAPMLAFAGGTPHTVTATATAHAGGVRGTVALAVPSGWSAEPDSRPFELGEAGDEVALRFDVTPPAQPGAGTLSATVDGARADTLLVVDHEHIEPRTVLEPARARLLRVDLRRPVDRIGYVMGSGDEIPAVLRQLGFDVELLDDEALLDADLSRYQAIVVGIRAANTRTGLAHAEDRLLRYAEAGGTVVVQYATTRGVLMDRLGPFPLELSRDRVTDETVPVTILAPDHPMMRTPNRITEADFAGWVQERGLYFPDHWDPRYTPLLAMADPGEPETRGALLVARYGHGTWIYTGLSFFRQLPAGVPGAIRLFANLLGGAARGD